MTAPLSPYHLSLGMIVTGRDVFEGGGLGLLDLLALEIATEASGDPFEPHYWTAALFLRPTLRP